MPFSNSGPHIDPNTPSNIQTYFTARTPDFVFQSTDPENNRRRIRSALSLSGSLLSMAVLTWAIFNSNLPKELNTGVIWEKIQQEYINGHQGVGDSDEKFLFFAIFLVAIAFIGIIMIQMIRDFIKIFQNRKLWYIGTDQELIIVRGKNATKYEWSKFMPDIEVKSTPLGDTLSYKLVPSIAKARMTTRSLVNLHGIMNSFKSLTIMNPPNMMEVKRLSEKRIRGKTKELPETMKFE